MRDLSRDPTPQPGDQIHQPGHPFDGFTVISVYTRAQAIADALTGYITTIVDRSTFLLSLFRSEKVESGHESISRQD